MYKWNYKKCFSNLITAAAAAVLVWFTLSYFEILYKQTFGGATYSEYNIITNVLYYFKIIW